MAITFNIKSNAFSQLGKVIDSAKLHADFNISNLSATNDAEARRSYIYTYAMLNNVKTFSQPDFDKNYYETIKATDPFAAANYIGYKAMGNKSQEFDDYWNQVKSHYEGEYIRKTSSGWDKFVSGVGNFVMQTWMTELNILDRWIDGIAIGLYDLDRFIKNPLTFSSPSGTEQLARKQYNDKLSNDDWVRWALGNKTIAEKTADSKINAYYTAGWYKDINDALDGPTDFLRGGDFSLGDAIELTLGLAESVTLMSLNAIPVVGPALYWTNVGLTSIADSRTADSALQTYGLSAAKFGVEYLSEQIFVDSFFKSGWLKPDKLYSGLASKPWAYIAAKIGTEMGTNAIEEMVAESANILLDWTVYNIVGSDLSGTLTTSDWNESYERIVGAGISGALVGMLGAGRSVAQGIYEASSYEVDGKKVSRVQDFTMRDFVGKMLEGFDGDANTRKVVDDLRSKGFNDEQIRQSDEYKKAYVADLKTQETFIKGMSSIQGALTQLGYDGLKVETVNKDIRETFGSMKTMLVNYDQNRELAISKSAEGKDSTTSARHRAITKKLNDEFTGTPFNFSVVESGSTNADLNTLSANTGFDDIVVVKVGSDGTRFKENAFVRGNTLYVNSDYYYKNFGSRSTVIREFVQAKVVNNLATHLGQMTNMAFYDKVGHLFDEAKGAYGHYFFIDLVQKHGVEQAKSMVVKALMSNPKLLQSLYVAQPSDFTTLVKAQQTLINEFNTLSKKDKDFEYKAAHTLLQVQMLNNTTNVVLDNLASFDTDLSQQVRTLINDAKITDKATLLLQVMNAHRDSILNNANTYYAAIVRALGFSDVLRNGNAELEVIKQEVVDYINSIGKMGFIASKNMTILEKGGNDIEVSSLANIIMSDIQLQMYLAKNVKGFNERFISGLRSLLMNPAIRDKGPALKTLSDYVRVMYAMAPTDVKEAMSKMMLGIRVSLQKQGIVVSGDEVINQQVEEMTNNADFEKQVSFALNWVAPIATDGKKATKIYKTIFPSLLANATTIDEVYTVLFGNNKANSEIHDRILAEVNDGNGVYNPASGMIKMPLLTLLNALGIVQDTLNKEINNAALIFVKNLTGLDATKENIEQNADVEFSLTRLSNASIHRALSKASGYVISRNDFTGELTTYQVTEMGKFFNFDLAGKRKSVEQTSPESKDLLLSDSNLYATQMAASTKLGDIFDIDGYMATVNIPAKKRDEVKKVLHNLTIVKRNSKRNGESDDVLGYYDPTGNSITLIVNNRTMGMANMLDILVHEITHAIANTITPDRAISGALLFSALRNSDKGTNSYVWGVFNVLGNLLTDTSTFDFDALIKGNKRELNHVLKLLGVSKLSDAEVKPLAQLIRLSARFLKEYKRTVGSIGDTAKMLRYVYASNLSEIVARRATDDKLINYLAPELFEGTGLIQLINAIENTIPTLPKSLLGVPYAGTRFALVDGHTIPELEYVDLLGQGLSVEDKRRFSLANDPIFSADDNYYKDEWFFHGTTTEGIYNNFSVEAAKRNGGGFYFILNKHIAGDYAYGRFAHGDAGEVFQVRIYSKKPLIVTADISGQSRYDLVDMLLRYDIDTRDGIFSARRLNPENYYPLTNKMAEMIWDTIVSHYIPVIDKDGRVGNRGKSFVQNVRAVVIDNMSKYGYDLYAGPYHGYNEGDYLEYVVHDPDQIGFRSTFEQLQFRNVNNPKFTDSKNKLKSVEVYAPKKETGLPTLIKAKYKKPDNFTFVGNSSLASNIDDVEKPKFKLYAENPLIIDADLKNAVPLKDIPLSDKRSWDELVDNIPEYLALSILKKQKALNIDGLSNEEITEKIIHEYFDVIKTKVDDPHYPLTDAELSMVITGATKYVVDTVDSRGFNTTKALDSYIKVLQYVNRVYEYTTSMGYDSEFPSIRMSEHLDSLNKNTLNDPNLVKNNIREIISLATSHIADYAFDKDASILKQIKDEFLYPFPPYWYKLSADDDVSTITSDNLDILHTRIERGLRSFEDIYDLAGRLGQIGDFGRAVLANFYLKDTKLSIPDGHDAIIYKTGIEEIGDIYKVKDESQVGYNDERLRYAINLNGVDVDGQDFDPAYSKRFALASDTKFSSDKNNELFRPDFYHGSTQVYDNVDASKVVASEGGLFYTMSKRWAGIYGPAVRRFRLYSEKPFVISRYHKNKDIVIEWMARYLLDIPDNMSIAEFAKTFDHTRDISSFSQQKYSNYIKVYLNAAKQQASTGFGIDKYTIETLTAKIFDLAQISIRPNALMKKAIFKNILKLGYDGYVGPHPDSQPIEDDTEYVVFSPEQVGFYPAKDSIELYKENQYGFFSRQLMSKLKKDITNLRYSINLSDKDKNNRFNTLRVVDSLVANAMDAYKGEDKDAIGTRISNLSDTINKIVDGTYNKPAEIKTFVDEIFSIAEAINLNLNDSFRTSVTQKLIIGDKPEEVVTPKQKKAKPEVVKEQPAQPINLDAIVSTLNKLTSDIENAKEGERIKFSPESTWNAVSKVIDEIGTMSDKDKREELLKVAKESRNGIVDVWGKMKDKTDTVKGTAEDARDALAKLVNFVNGVDSPKPAEVEKVTNAKEPQKVEPVKVVKPSTPAKTVVRKNAVPDAVIGGKLPTIGTTLKGDQRKEQLTAEAKQVKREVGVPRGYQRFRLPDVPGGWIVKDDLAKDSRLTQAITNLEKVFNTIYAYAPDRSLLQRLARMNDKKSEVVEKDKRWEYYGAKDAKDLYDQIVKEISEITVWNNNARSVLKYGAKGEDGASDTKSAIFNTIDDITKLTTKLENSLQPYWIKAKVRTDMIKTILSLVEVTLSTSELKAKTDKELTRKTNELKRINEQVEKTEQNIAKAKEERAKLKTEVNELNTTKKARLTNSQQRYLTAVKNTLQEKVDNGTATNLDSFILGLITDAYTTFEDVMSLQNSNGEYIIDYIEQDKAKELIKNKIVDILMAKLSSDDIIKLSRLTISHAGGISEYRNAINAGIKDSLDDDGIYLAPIFEDALRIAKERITEAKKNDAGVETTLGKLDDIKRILLQDMEQYGLTARNLRITHNALGNILNPLSTKENNWMLPMVSDKIDEIAKALIQYGGLYNVNGALTPNGEWVHSMLLNIKQLYSKYGLPLPKSLTREVDSILPRYRPSKDTDESKKGVVVPAPVVGSPSASGKGDVVAIGGEIEYAGAEFIRDAREVIKGTRYSLSDKLAAILVQTVKYSTSYQESTISHSANISEVMYRDNRYGDFFETFDHMLSKLTYAEWEEIARFFYGAQELNVPLPNNVVSNIINLSRYFERVYAINTPVSESNAALEMARRRSIMSKFNTVIAIGAVSSASTLGKLSRSGAYMDSYANKGNVVLGYRSALLSHMMNVRGLSKNDALGEIDNMSYAISLKRIIDAQQQASKQGNTKPLANLATELRNILRRSLQYIETQPDGSKVVNEEAIDNAVASLLSGESVTLNMDDLADLYDAAMSLGEYGVAKYIDSIFQEQATKVVGEIGGVTDLVKNAIKGNIKEGVIKDIVKSVINNPKVSADLKKWVVDNLSKNQPLSKGQFDVVYKMIEESSTMDDATKDSLKRSFSSITKLSDTERREITDQIAKRVTAFRYMALLSNPSVYVKNVTMNALNKVVNVGAVDILTKHIRDFLEGNTKLAKLLKVNVAKKFRTKVDSNKSHLLNGNGDYVNYTYKDNRWIYGGNVQSDITAMVYTDEDIAEIRKQEPLVELYARPVDVGNQLRISTGKIKSSKEAKDFVQKHLIDNEFLSLLIDRSKGLSRGVNEATFDKYVQSIVPFGTKTPISRALRWTHTKMYDALEGMDMKAIRELTIRYVTQMVEANGLYKMEVTAYNIEAYNAIIQKYVEVAVLQALDVVFKSDSAFLRFFHELQGKHPAARLITSAMLPFARISFNIVKQIYEYSPFGLLKTVADIIKVGTKGYEVNRENITDRFKLEGLSKSASKGIIGTTFMALGFMLGALGFIRIDEDKEYNGYVVYIDGESIKIDISSLSTLSAPILLGASLSGFGREPFKDTMSSMINQYLNMTFLGNLLDTARTYDVTTIPADVLEDYLVSYSPSILKSVVRAITNTEKQYAPGGWEATWFQRVFERSLPMFAQDRVDPYTGDKDYLMDRDFALLINIWNAVGFAPVYYYEKSDEQKLMEEYGLTMGTSTNTKLNFMGVDVELSDQDRRAYNIERAKAFRWLVKEAQASSAWRKSNTAEKEKILNGIKSASSTFAKTKLWLDRNPTNYYQYTSNNTYGSMMAKYYKYSRIRKVTDLKEKGENYYGKWL